MTGTVRIALVIAALIVGTWFIGWTAVPIVALVCGLAAIAPRVIAMSAGIAWILLLLGDIAHASFSHLVGLLAEVMGLPGALLLMMTIVFPILLAWSAATIGNALRSIRLPHAGPGQRSLAADDRNREQ